jgi:hypothetical protein
VKRLFIPFTLLLVYAFFITGSSSSNAPTTTAPASSSAPPKTTGAPATAPQTAASPTAQPQYGGTLRIILGFGFGTNLGNPVVAGMSPITSFFALPCGDSLTEFDSKGNLVPLLAESWDMDPYKLMGSLEHQPFNPCPNRPAGFSGAQGQQCSLEFSENRLSGVRPAARKKFITIELENDKVKFGELPLAFWGDMKANYESHNKDYAGVYKG